MNTMITDLSYVLLGNLSSRHGVTGPVYCGNDGQLSAAYLVEKAQCTFYPTRCSAFAQYLLMLGVHWMCGEWKSHFLKVSSSTFTDRMDNTKSVPLSIPHTSVRESRLGRCFITRTLCSALIVDMCFVINSWCSATAIYSC